MNGTSLCPTRQAWAEDLFGELELEMLRARLDTQEGWMDGCCHARGGA